VKTRASLVFRILSVIVVTGLFPFLVMSLVSAFVLRPFISRIDEQNAAADMDHILGEIDSLIENEKISIRSITAYLTTGEQDLGESDYLAIMDIYSIDALALSSGRSFDRMPLWIRTGKGISDIRDARRFLESVLKGPFAVEPLNPWGFISAGDFSDLYLLSSSSSAADGEKIIVGHSMSSVVERYMSHNPDHRIGFSSTPQRKDSAAILSFVLNEKTAFTPVTPDAMSFDTRGNTTAISIVVEAPYLENGLMVTLERPTLYSESDMDRLFRALAVGAAILIVQVLLVALWFRRRVFLPLTGLIAGIEAWDGLRLPDFGSLAARNDEIGKLSRTFAQMSAEIRSKTRALEEQAMKDGLTGLFNRRRFDETLQNEWDRHQRDQVSLALILADIDHFKSYNDTCGHPVGDDCLRRVAGVCGKVLRRPGDIPFRYGGEEFALILADTDSDGAAAVAESIRRGVEDLNIENRGSPSGGRITISLGVAVTGPGNRIVRDELLRNADRNLYIAKDTGRNRVVR
jgi:diguanylate cyclase (GGDEF)-like protein